jgi:hypothetical protein
MCLLRLTLGATIAAFLAGCSGNMSSDGSFVPGAQTQAPTRLTPVAAVHPQQGSLNGYVYVTNHTAQGASQLVVYPAGVQSAPPTRTITQGIVGAMGVAVDSSGNVYVANGSGGNVLEYSPGGTSLVNTYSSGLTYPVGVAVSGSTLYVADRGNGSNGIQQVVEYSIGTSTPQPEQIAGPGFPPQLNEGIAVNPLGFSGTFYASATTVPIPPTSGCSLSGSYLVAEEHSPILWQAISPLSGNGQVSGVAFDSSGNLYAADPCANHVAVYSNVNGAWTYSHNVTGTFAAPVLLTINNQTLAVPSSGNGSGSGYVTIIDLTGKNPTVKITNGLTHPVGAAVGSGS